MMVIGGEDSTFKYSEMDNTGLGLAADVHINIVHFMTEHHSCPLAPSQHVLVEQVITSHPPSLILSDPFLTVNPDSNVPRTVPKIFLAPPSHWM